MNLKQKIGTGIAIGTMAASILAPAAYAEVTIKDNGAFSHNFVGLFSFLKKKVEQKNRTNVSTSVSTSSNTGGNSIKFNVGGTNTILSGATSTAVGISVTGNSNTNESEGCCCDGEGEETSVEISGNGAFSHNKVIIGDKCIDIVKQSNSTYVSTSVSSSSNTGGNDIKFNVGGDNIIGTGDTTTGVVVEVEGGTNSN